MATQEHRSDPGILGRRTLARDHRCLAGLLRPGMTVLDVGCGTGAITADIARVVGPDGEAVGVDRDDAMLETARTVHAGVSALRFERSDATTLEFEAQFDIVTAARTLQWIADPALAVVKMKQAVKPGGLVVVLDYNHVSNGWEPEPPPSFRRFYDAFLAWRESNGWDNQMGDHLPELFRAAGLAEVSSQVEDEIAERATPDFGPQTAIWTGVIDVTGGRMEAAGFCTNAELKEAREDYESWVRGTLVKQTLVLRAVMGRAG